jgi:vanadium chloroperoxidase
MPPAAAPSYRFGISVGNAILDALDIKPNEPGADQGQYRPQAGRFRFRDDPTNPVKLVPVNPNLPDAKRGSTSTPCAVVRNHSQAVCGA